MTLKKLVVLFGLTFTLGLSLGAQAHARPVGTLLEAPTEQSAPQSVSTPASAPVAQATVLTPAPAPQVTRVQYAGRPTPSGYTTPRRPDHIPRGQFVCYLGEELGFPGMQLCTADTVPGPRGYVRRSYNVNYWVFDRHGQHVGGLVNGEFIPAQRPSVNYAASPYGDQPYGSQPYRAPMQPYPYRPPVQSYPTYPSQYRGNYQYFEHTGPRRDYAYHCNWTPDVPGGGGGPRRICPDPHEY